MAKKEINRALSEMDADRIYSGEIFSETITGTNLVNLGAISFKSMGSFSLSIVPVLASGSAPTSLTVTFNKFINGIQPKGSSLVKVISAVDIVSSPAGIIVNVQDLTPETVFTDLEVTVQSSDTTDIELSIIVVGD